MTRCGVRLGGFVPVDLSRKQAANEPVVVVHDDRATGVHHLVIPGGNLAVCLVLGEVPVGRNVGVCTAEDDHDRRARGATLPQRIRTRDVRQQRAVRATVGVELEGDVIRLGPCLSLRDQHTERMSADDAMHFFGAGFGEVRRDVHDWMSSVGTMQEPLSGAPARALRGDHSAPANTRRQNHDGCGHPQWYRPQVCQTVDSDQGTEAGICEHGDRQRPAGRRCPERASFTD